MRGVSGARQSAMGRLAARARGGLAAGALLLSLLFPPVALYAGQDYLLSFAARILAFAIAATSLNLILGYGGLVSFGHAAFVGVGAYTLGILAKEGVRSAWVAWPLSLLTAALAALLIGSLALRTRGIYFIMITLAFAQMLYYAVVSLRVYGGEDGMAVPRSLLLPGLGLENGVLLYYLALAALGLTLWITHRLVQAPFGWVLQAARDNPSRAACLGFPVFQFQLGAFVIAGTMAGMAGILLANLNGWVSPSFLSWHLSGQLMMMVILGGVARLWGGVVGAAVYLVLETFLSEFTIHWQLFLGLFLLAAVLLSKRGLVGMGGER